MLVLPALMLMQTAGVKPAVVKPKIGWDDGFKSVAAWTPLPGRPLVVLGRHGTMKMTLPAVPKDWPYSYQWSGVSRDVSIDLGRHHVMLAELGDVKGYAHMDIDMLDDKDKVVANFRSSTLTKPGVLRWDYGRKIDNPTYRLRVRLIVGGPNEGCSATYNWVRFVDPLDIDNNP